MCSIWQRSRPDEPVLCDSVRSELTVEERERASGCYQAMRTLMLTDRIGKRARSGEVVVFGGSVLSDHGDGAERWTAERGRHLAQAAALARSI